MKINIIFLTAILTIIFILTLLLDRHKVDQVNAIAPNFTYQTIDGQTNTLYRLNTQPHKKILVHFWATWCAPCIVEFPRLEKLAKKYPNDLIILTISVDKTVETIQKFLKKTNVSQTNNFILAHDPDQIITKDTYSVNQFPESFILNYNFHIKKRIIGGDENWLSPEWSQAIQK